MRNDFPDEAEPLASDFADEDRSPGLLELMMPLAQRWRSILGVFVVAGALGTGIAFAIAPVFTASTTFIPPQQQQQTGASAALASLGAIASLGGAKSPGDEYVTFLESATIRDRIIDRFGLMKVYEQEFRDKTRAQLAKNVRASIGKKDGLITVDVDDTDPKRAAAIANQYVEELRQMTSVLAVSEAQRRRVFFEKQMKDTQARLADAQVALQGSGISAGALKTAPQEAAEGYASLRAQLTTAQVILETARGSMREGTPEVQQLSARVQALRQQIAQLEQSDTANGKGADYVSRYREFKYQETLFDMMARQFELARVDEAREGAIIQVVDAAQPPEHKSRPKRLVVGLLTALAAVVAYSAWLVVRARMRVSLEDSEAAQRWQRFRGAFARSRTS